MKPVNELFGENLKYYRIKNNLTQEELSEKCDLSTRYISKIENNNSNVTLSVLELFATILGVEPYKLIKSENNYILHAKIYKKGNKKLKK